MGGERIVLNMIVKNESKIVERCLDAAAWVDAFVISDTGSTDDTVARIEAWGRRNGKPGQVARAAWKNFGHNRTVAIGQAKQWCLDEGWDLTRTYLLFLDADMVFKGACLREVVGEADVWDVRQQNPSIVYANLRVVRASVDIVCVCPTHEYYDIRTPDVVRKIFEGAAIEDIGDGGSKDDKAQRDIRMLEEALKTEPRNCRYWFYLANTYRDTHDYTKAIWAYKKRIEVGGWFEETYCAMVYKGDCHYVIKDYPHAIDSWLKAYSVDPERSEALVRLSIYYRTTSQHHTAMLFIDKGLRTPIPMERQLFLERPVYEHHFLYELSVCAFYVGQLERGLLACEMLLRMPSIPEAIRASVQNNIRFYQQKRR